MQRYCSFFTESHHYVSTLITLITWYSCQLVHSCCLLGVRLVSGARQEGTEDIQPGVNQIHSTIVLPRLLKNTSYKSGKSQPILQPIHDAMAGWGWQSSWSSDAARALRHDRGGGGQRIHHCLRWYASPQVGCMPVCHASCLVPRKYCCMGAVVC